MIQQAEEIHGYKISHYGNVSRGLRYIEQHWESEKVKEIFRESREAGRAGHDFSIDTYGYTMFHDGDYKYFLKAR